MNQLVAIGVAVAIAFGPGGGDRHPRPERESRVDTSGDQMPQRSYVLTPFPDGTDPEVTRAEALRRVDNTWNEPVLRVRSGLFTDLDHMRVRDRKLLTKEVPAWVITVHTCVPIFGPDVTDNDQCASDRMHVVIDARTGTEILAFG